MIKPWLQAARLRTLPLSVSGILVGSAVAAYQQQFDWRIFIGCIFTTIGLQVLSNFANDYGDGVKGTDNEHRIGPQRAIQSGAITPSQMKRVMIFTGIVTFLIALWLIYISFEGTSLGYTLLFIGLGVASIVAAIKYTVGKSAYGYSGFGDIFVFVFFGLLSVIGSYFLYTKSIYTPLWLPAISMGLLSTAVLNLNNMRDRINDKASKKNTLVVKWGLAKAKKYHSTIIIIAMLCMVIFTFWNGYQISHWIYLLLFQPLLKHLKFVKQNEEEKDFDPELKKVALSTFFVALLFAIGLLIW